MKKNEKIILILALVALIVSTVTYYVLFAINTHDLINVNKNQDIVDSLSNDNRWFNIDIDEKEEIIKIDFTEKEDMFSIKYRVGKNVEKEFKPFTDLTINFGVDSVVMSGSINNTEVYEKEENISKDYVKENYFDVLNFDATNIVVKDVHYDYFPFVFQHYPDVTLELEFKENIIIDLKKVNIKLELDAYDISGKLDNELDDQYQLNGDFTSKDNLDLCLFTINQ